MNTTFVPLTAGDLLAERCNARVQRAFSIYYQSHLLPDDSAAGDREIREACADTFAETINWKVSHVGMTLESALLSL